MSSRTPKSTSRPAIPKPDGRRSLDPYQHRGHPAADPPAGGAAFPRPVRRGGLECLHHVPVRVAVRAIGRRGVAIRLCAVANQAPKPAGLFPPGPDGPDLPGGPARSPPALAADRPVRVRGPRAPRETGPADTG